jgi:hypothetical protein
LLDASCNIIENMDCMFRILIQYSVWCICNHLLYNKDEKLKFSVFIILILVSMYQSVKCT